MKVQLIKIPKATLIKQATTSNDFEDCFTTTFESKKNISLDECVYDCFNAFNGGWIDALFRLRNQLVKPFGLKTAPDNRPKQVERPRIEKGGYVSFFEVRNHNTEEVLLYADDSHLSAYFSIILSQNGNSKTFYASTTVQLRNRMGKYYFAVVKPFHTQIIKSMVRKIAKHYSNN